ncbi:MAG: class I SAM-dependent methyltransferase [Rhodobacter sp.]|jgi:predicted TPR repeat methyltransferase|nr:methyltransferase domain-containing protein [Rhodobacter sp.]MCE2747914.1 class I SAM-dependent methyltransferase [Rhodobacter sp.]
MTEPDLHAAFALRSPDDCLRLYRDWAATYDAGFAADMEYRLPAHVAGAFMAAGGTGPVLDVGAGTGLLAGALRGLGFRDEIDGIDLSPQMLEQARAKGIYRHLTKADVTRPLPLPGGYRGIVSSGTFTHGHVGPVALAPVFAVAAAGALFALSVNLRVWSAAGFDTALAAMGRQVRDLQMTQVAIYGAAAARLDPDHADDRAMIVLFRKA